jgi:hypothetical protein
MTRPLAPNEYTEVISVTNEPKAATVKLPVEFIQNDVRQQR